MKKLNILVALILVLSAISFVACTDSPPPAEEPFTFTLINESTEYSVSSRVEMDNLVIPKTYNGLPVTEIADRGFSSAEGTKTITIPDSIKKIGEWAFEYSGITKITIPNSVTFIGKLAFSHCENLTEVIINGRITSIEEGTFQACSNLQKITLPDSLLKIEPFAFWYCTALENFAVPKSVIEIAHATFLSCYSLKSFIIPDAVTTIGTRIFQDMNFESKVTVYAETPVQPSGWDNVWNQKIIGIKYYRPVIWGCILSEDKSYVVSFFNSSGRIDNPDEHSISAPYREGFTFGGWSLTEGGTTADYDMTNISSAPNARLYAIWLLQP